MEKNQAGGGGGGGGPGGCAAVGIGAPPPHPATPPRTPAGVNNRKRSSVRVSVGPCLQHIETEVKKVWVGMFGRRFEPRAATVLDSLAFFLQLFCSEQ